MCANMMLRMPLHFHINTHMHIACGNAGMYAYMHDITYSDADVHTFMHACIPAHLHNILHAAMPRHVHTFMYNA